MDAEDTLALDAGRVVELASPTFSAGVEPTGRVVRRVWSFPPQHKYPHRPRSASRRRSSGAHASAAPLRAYDRWSPAFSQMRATPARWMPSSVGGTQLTPPSRSATRSQWRRGSPEGQRLGLIVRVAPDHQARQLPARFRSARERCPVSREAGRHPRARRLLPGKSCV